MPQDLVARFVDKIDASRTVRLNINDRVTWRLQLDSRFDPPPAKRARASTMLTHGGSYPASAYDDRELELRLLLETDSANLAADEIQKLARELDRRDPTGESGNILEYQPPTATHPVFFRTWPIGLETVDMPTDGTQHWLTVRVPAEPFAYGLREDPVIAQTVNFDPAAASNGGFFDVAAAAIKGDVETPVKMILPTSLAGKVSLFGVRRRGDPTQVPFFLQAEAMTVGADTTTQANDAAFSGAGNNWTRTTFATQTGLVPRLTMTTFPASPSIGARGDYRLFVRARSSVAVNMLAEFGPADTDTSAGIVAHAGTSALIVFDLGILSLPSTQSPIVDMVTGSPLSVVGQKLRLLVQRVGVSGNFDADLFLLVPADDRLAFVQWASVAPTTDFVVDGVREVVYGRDASGREESLNFDPLLTGGFPLLAPNQATRIFFVYDVGGGTTTIGTSHSVSLSYFPRYLYVRGPAG